jgi:hypothetical protein
MKHLAALILFLIAQPTWAFTINVTPTAKAQATLADIKRDPNTPVTLTQALALRKNPELRDGTGILKENINIHLYAGNYPISETLHLDAASSGSGSAEHMVMIEGKLIKHYGDINPWALETCVRSYQNPYPRAASNMTEQDVSYRHIRKALRALPLEHESMKIATARTGYIGLSNAILLAQHNEDHKIESDPISLGIENKTIRGNE